MTLGKKREKDNWIWENGVEISIFYFDATVYCIDQDHGLYKVFLDKDLKKVLLLLKSMHFLRQKFDQQAAT